MKGFLERKRQSTEVSIRLEQLLSALQAALEQIQWECDEQSARIAALEARIAALER